jgi:hypothetical protein
VRRQLAALIAALVVGIAGAAPAASGVQSDGEPAPSSRAAVIQPAGGERLPFTGIDFALLLAGSLAVIGLGAGVRHVTGERA